MEQSNTIQRRGKRRPQVSLPPLDDIRSTSPRDKTPIIVSGQQISRESIPPIAATGVDIPGTQSTTRPQSPRDAIPNLDDMPPIIDITSDEQLPSVKIVLSPRSESIINNEITENTPISTRPPSAPKSQTQSPQIRPVARSPRPQIQRPASERPQSSSRQQYSQPSPRPTSERQQYEEPSNTRIDPIESIIERNRYLDDLPHLQQLEIREQYDNELRSLMRSHTGLNIRPAAETTPLSIIVSRCQLIERQIKIFSKAGWYRYFLVIYWLFLEWFSTNILSLEASEYTSFQVKLMSQYDKMLIELSEKNVSDIFSQWPVEARLLIINVLILIAFIFIKTVGSWINPTLVPTLLEALKNMAPVLTGETPSTGNDMPSMMGAMGSQLLRNGGLGTVIGNVFGQPQQTPNQARQPYRPRYEE